jgi:hypothetical protein
MDARSRVEKKPQEDSDLFPRIPGSRACAPITSVQARISVRMFAARIDNPMAPVYPSQPAALAGV